jgi:hypothetical protein
MEGYAFMNSRKAIGGSFGAIAILVIAQILAQLMASLFVLIKIPEAMQACTTSNRIKYVTRGIYGVLL